MTAAPAGLGRRLAAVLYDSLLVFALLILATAPFVPITPADRIPDGVLKPVPDNPLHQALMFVVVFGYFVGYWAWKGRTLGMQSWGLQLETSNGQTPRAAACAVRFFAAVLSWLPCGLGFAWQLWDPDRRTWHDRLSSTWLRHYPRPGK